MLSSDISSSSMPGLRLTTLTRRPGPQICSGIFEDARRALEEVRARCVSLTKGPPPRNYRHASSLSIPFGDYCDCYLHSASRPSRPRRRRRRPLTAKAFTFGRRPHQVAFLDRCNFRWPEQSCAIDGMRFFKSMEWAFSSDKENKGLLQCY